MPHPATEHISASGRCHFLVKMEPHAQLHLCRTLYVTSQAGDGAR